MTGKAANGHFDTHVCLVSQQATPNLTPVLDPEFGPARLVMLVTPEMSQRAQWLESVLRSRTHVKVERIEVTDAWDMHGVLEQLIQWIDQQAPDASIALNVTGGTKPMAMAAQQAFAMAGLAVFYVHPTRDEVQWLEPRLPAFTLNNRLKLEDYLAAHGWSVLQRPPRRRPPAHLNALTQELVLGFDERARSIGLLNGYAQECERMGLLAITLDSRDADDTRFRATLGDFERAGACRVEGQQLHFSDEAARFFCKGGWLEDYAAEVVATLPADVGIQDWAAGVQVRSLANNLPGLGGSNELDVAILAHNRLHLVECKTRNLGDEGGAAGALYKLDALTSLGGLNTASLLVSYRKLAAGERQRAKDLGIQTCVGSQLANLRGTLIKWIKTRA